MHELSRMLAHTALAAILRFFDIVPTALCFVGKEFMATNIRMGKKFWKRECYFSQ